MIRAISRPCFSAPLGTPTWHNVLPRLILHLLFPVAVGHVEDNTHAHHAWYHTHSCTPSNHISYLIFGDYNLDTGQLDWVLRFSHHTLSPPQVASDVLGYNSREMYLMVTLRVSACSSRQGASNDRLVCLLLKRNEDDITRQRCTIGVGGTSSATRTATCCSGGPRWGSCRTPPKHHVTLWISLWRRVLLEIHSFTSRATCVQHAHGACNTTTCAQVAVVCWFRPVCIPWCAGMWWVWQHPICRD